MGFQIILVVGPPYMCKHISIEMYACALKNQLKYCNYSMYYIVVSSFAMYDWRLVWSFVQAYRIDGMCIGRSLLYAHKKNVFYVPHSLDSEVPLLITFRKMFSRVQRPHLYISTKLGHIRSKFFYSLLLSFVLSFVHYLALVVLSLAHLCLWVYLLISYTFRLLRRHRHHRHRLDSRERCAFFFFFSSFSMFFIYSMRLFNIKTHLHS